MSEQISYRRTWLDWPDDFTPEIGFDYMAGISHMLPAIVARLRTGGHSWSHRQNVNEMNDGQFESWAVSVPDEHDETKTTIITEQVLTDKVCYIVNTIHEVLDTTSDEHDTNVLKTYVLVLDRSKGSPLHAHFDMALRTDDESMPHEPVSSLNPSEGYLLCESARSLKDFSDLRARELFDLLTEADSLISDLT